MATESRPDTSDEGSSADWTPVGNVVSMTAGVVVADAPGLFWLYIFVDALRSAESSAYWFGPTPTGELSVAAQYSPAIVLAVVWTGMVLALFGGPLKESFDELRE